MKVKKCNKCKEQKPLSGIYFNRNKNNVDNFDDHCMKCKSKYRKERRKQEKNHLAYRAKNNAFDGFWLGPDSIY